ncbi:MAG TPA: M23 family metallopeptidase [Gemmatimonadaceae bacterium]|nr:M23 family metallopeptidase [Gemmatimonadaceae bacterium]
MLWLAVFAPRSIVGWAAQLIGSLLVLAAIARIGVWLFPPWWTPYAAAACLGLVAVWQFRRGRLERGMPRDVPGWLRLAVFLVVAIFAAFQVLHTRAAARIPDGAIVDLQLPLGRGRYLVVNGGDALLVNAHQASMDTSIARLQPWRGNGYAVDLVAIDATGLRASGLLPPDPAAYEIFGDPVLAPCAGQVVRVADGLPDMRVPQYDREHPAGNHVFLACNGVHVLVGHLRQGSIRVQPGAELAVGDTIGLVGNSGGTDEPHLHVHAQRPGPADAPFAGDPLPMRIEGRFLVRGDRIGRR